MRTLGSSKEIYVSVDVETDGPAPGPNSMLSIGCVAVRRVGDVMVANETFYQTLTRLPAASPDANTMAFWEQHPKAYAAATADPLPPGQVMHELREWLSNLGGDPVFVADPVAFDFMFVAHYFHSFLGENPFGWSGLDLHTLAWVKTRGGFKRGLTRELPLTWVESEHVHDHHALHDAQQQADQFIGIVRGMDATARRHGEVRDLLRQASGRL